MNLEQVYENLTGVSITEQEQIWDERGKGYFGEFLVFKTLFEGIDGPGKFLMNVEIPGLHTEKTEIDLMFLHPKGIFVFEVKHYKGTIYGKVTDRYWTQFFKTVKNNKFYSPVMQNNGHIEALRALIKKDVPIHSFVVFTHPEVIIRVTGRQENLTICRLEELRRMFNTVASSMPEVYDLEQLNNQYSSLLQYSKVRESQIPMDDSSLTLPEYLEMLTEEKKTLEAEYKKKRQKDIKIGLIAFLAVIIAAAIGAFGFVNIERKQADNRVEQYKMAADRALLSRDAAAQEAEKARAETDEMRRNFSHARPLQESGYNLTDSVLTASNVTVTPSKEIEKAVVISGTINIKSDTYSFLFSGSKIIVQLTDGTVKEYDLPSYNSSGLGFQEIFTYHNKPLSLSTYGHYLTLPELVPEEIEYIKLRNIGLCQFPFSTVLTRDIELELYSREDLPH